MHILFHVDDETIWVACSPAFTTTGRTLQELVAMAAQADQISFYAIPENAPVVVELLRDAVDRVYRPLAAVGVPRKPWEALQQLCVSTYGTMLSNRLCRHTMNDVPAWLLAAADKSDEGILKSLLAEHAIYPLATFCATLNPEPLAWLIGEVLTPERFTHPNAPCRWSRLHAWCELSAASATAYLDGQPCGRAHYAYASWATNSPGSAKAAGAFLHRIAGPKMTPLGVLKATRFWLSLLMRYWSASQRKPADCGVAKLWFNRDGERDAFARHLQAFRS